MQHDYTILSKRIFLRPIEEADIENLRVLRNSKRQFFLGSDEITPEMQNLEAYMKSFWAYGIYGWMLEWIKRGMQESGKELSALFSLAHQK